MFLGMLVTEFSFRQFLSFNSRWPGRLTQLRRVEARLQLHPGGPHMKSGASDTPPPIERLLIEGYRRMPPAEKLERVAALNRAVDQLARARIRAQYGEDLTERELRLRLAALRLDRRVMVEVFGWDPGIRGL
jgi:hypothetical protein